MTADPIYPSARALVPPSRYGAAVEALVGVRRVFCDGRTILLPEIETDAIALLRAHFDADIEYGQALEWEFATKARAAGLQEGLVRLGHAVADVSGMSAADMLRQALEHPHGARMAWRTLYLASLNEQ